MPKRRTNKASKQKQILRADLVGARANHLLHFNQEIEMSRRWGLLHAKQLVQLRLLRALEVQAEKIQEPALLRAKFRARAALPSRA